MRLSTFLACLFLMSPLLRSDQIILQNGDRVTGSIIKKVEGTLTVRSAHFGTITMPWVQVQSVATNAPVHIELESGETLHGSLTVTGGSAEIATMSGTRTETTNNLIALRSEAEQRNYEGLLDPGWTDLWRGSVNMGTSGATGNAQTVTFTTGFDVARTSVADKASVYFKAIKASALVDGEKAATAKAVRGGWAYSRNTGPRLFANFFNDYEYDRFQSLDLRFVAGSGLGYSVWKGERRRLDLLGGGAYTRESFTTPLIRNSASAYWGDDLSLQVNSITTLSQSFRMFNNLTETGDYRVTFDAGAVNKLTQWLSWNVSLSDRYSNNPAPGRKTNDFLYSTGLGFTFAR
jgi:hypothetical protein